MGLEHCTHVIATQRLLWKCSLEKIQKYTLFSQGENRKTWFVVAAAAAAVVVVVVVVVVVSRVSLLVTV